MILSQLTKVPKVVLHSHFEGSIPKSQIYRLARKNNISLQFDYHDSGQISWDIFLKKYTEICSCIRSSEDIAESIGAYAKNLASKGVKYAELTFTPFAHINRGIGYSYLSEGIYTGVSNAISRYGVTIKLIADLVRINVEKPYDLLDWMNDHTYEIVALGFSGDDSGIPFSEYRDVCEKAKSKGLKIVAHAGELSGPESIELAIKHLQVDRISHGVRVVEDSRLFDHIVKQQLHLELCPTSNLKLGITDQSFSAIRQIIEAGANFSINPDDELIFTTDIVYEYLQLIKHNVLTPASLIRSLFNSINASFASGAEKYFLTTQLHDYQETAL